jgi:hypothetical protein
MLYSDCVVFRLSAEKTDRIPRRGYIYRRNWCEAFASIAGMALLAWIIIDHVRAESVLFMKLDHCSGVSAIIFIALSVFSTSAQMQDRFFGTWQSQEGGRVFKVNISTNSMVVSDGNTNKVYRLMSGTNLLFGITLDSNGNQLQAKASWKSDEMFFYLGTNMYFLKKQQFADQPLSDSDIRRKIIGTWGVDQNDRHARTTFMTNGTSQSTNWVTGRQILNAVSYSEGAWEIKDGFLIETVTKTTNPRLDPLDTVWRAKIISLTETGMAAVNSFGNTNRGERIQK